MSLIMAFPIRKSHLIIGAYEYGINALHSKQTCFLSETQPGPDCLEIYEGVIASQSKQYLSRKIHKHNCDGSQIYSVRGLRA